MHGESIGLAPILKFRKLVSGMVESFSEPGPPEFLAINASDPVSFQQMPFVLTSARANFYFPH